MDREATFKGVAVSNLESNMHYYAKVALANWLVLAARKHFAAHSEEWKDRVPLGGGLLWMENSGLKNKYGVRIEYEHEMDYQKYVFDIAVIGTHTGDDEFIRTAIEIVYKSPPSTAKLNALEDADFTTYFFKAEMIMHMQHGTLPDRLRPEYSLGMGRKWQAYPERWFSLWRINSVGDNPL